MKRIFVLEFFLAVFFNLQSTAQNNLTPDSLQAKIILIGDAGELTNGRQPVLSGVKSAIHFDEKTTIIYLGDNLYNTGLPDEGTPGYATLKAALDSQIHIADNSKARVFFMPGNHDWNDGNPGGYERIVRQQQYVDNAGVKNVKFYPEDGCPGPVEVSITPDVTLIIMDSQWWVHPYDKPGIESDCPFKTKAEVLIQLDDILSRNSKKLVLITFHHTLRSYGIHGGYYTLKQHIFPFTDVFPKAYIPLPIIGSIYPITRGIFGTSEDLSHPAYASMIADIDGVVKGHQNVIFAAGHEHTLQLIKDSSFYYIVSGAGSKSTRVNKNKKLLFGAQKNGFATLEISKNKNVSTTFYTLDSNKIKNAFTTHLLNFASIQTPENPADTVREAEIAFKDSVIISASDKYKKPNGLRKVVLGNNYRKEWSTPIKLKVFNIRKEKGGLKVASLGGGIQTKSLRLTDKNDKEWILRSVDKDPEGIIPPELRAYVPKGIVQDMISASHPFASLITPALAKATDITESARQIFYVPDDPALGIYRKIFANTVCILEESDPTLNTNTKSTAKVIGKLLDDHDNHIDQQAYLNARLLDNVIGDWDRHFDQWRWGTTDTGKGKLYYPIPKSRDQAFFNSDGWLLGYLSANQFKYLQGFKKRFYDIRWLNWEARDLDRIFMNQLTKANWKQAIDHFQNNLSDGAIESAVKNLPPEVYPFGASRIIDKLKSRRERLPKQGIKFYNFLSKDVNIIGSNQQEYFKVKNDGKDLQVIVYRKTNKKDSAGIIYNRSFDPKITKEVRLYGLNGNDKFEIEEGTTSKIKVRMIGGKGNDTFNIKGNVHNSIYDIVSTDTAEKNTIISKSKSDIEFSSNPAVNEYKPQGESYNIYRFPRVSVGYNDEDKLLIGFGASVKTFGFRKDPYSTYQQLSALLAPAYGAYQIKYQGIANSILLKKDIIFNAEYVHPTLNNFFGFGNSTINNTSKSAEFYRVRYQYFQTDVLLRKRFNNFLEFSFGPSYYHYSNDFTNNKNSILAKPALIGLDSTSIYSAKDYLGGKLRMDINFVNNEIFPSRGIRWYNEFSVMGGINDNSKKISKITSDMTVYASLNEERSLAAVLKLGGGHIFSDSFEYFQALTLGANNFDRGFNKNRFSGSSLFYSSVEIRKRIFKSQSYILPGDIGVIGFYDIGRVWMKGQTSHQWHQSYGGGLYYSPFDIVVLAATVGISDETNLLNFSLGTKFHLTF